MAAPRPSPAEPPAQSTRPHVAVVGAGVAGLVCAKELAARGCDVTLLEGGRGVGGRVATDRRPDGFMLDRGFQILIKSYPELRRQLDLPGLGLRSFGQGAVLCVDDGAAAGQAAANVGVRRHVFANPLTCPGLLFQTLRLVWRWGVVATLMDVARLLLHVAIPGWLRFMLRADPYAALRERWGFGLGAHGCERRRSRHEATTSEFLEGSVGLSSGFLTEFVEPFFEAIYVSELRFQHPGMFEFVLGRLAVPGSAALPAGGIAAVPEQLLEKGAEAAARTGSCFNVQLETRVTSISPSVGEAGLQLRLRAEGTAHEWCTAHFDGVVVATEWPAAAALLGKTELEQERQPVQATASCTWYFALPEAALPVREQLIVLNATGARRRRGRGGAGAAAGRAPLLGEEEAGGFRVCDIGFPSVVQRSYAPEGHHLCAVTVMSTGEPGAPSAKAALAAVQERWVRGEVSRLLGCSAALDPAVWRLLEQIPILFHQPAQAPETLQRLIKRADVAAAEEEKSRVFVCGDWRSTPTLDGAMLSGRLAAERAFSVLNR